MSEQNLEYRIVNKNPELTNGGAEWFPQGGTEKVGLAFNRTESLAKGFMHEVVVVPAFGFTSCTWTEAGIGEPYEHPDSICPQLWEFDVPLEGEHEFHFDSVIRKWEINKQGYLSTGFGGWVILHKPYTITGYRPLHRKIEYKSRILELMFSTRNEQFKENIHAGGNDWHRIIWRTGLHFDMSAAWFIFQYILDQAPIGKRTLHHLNSSTFSELIDWLNDQLIQEKNIIGPLMHELHEKLFCADPVINNLNLEKAKFRVAYIYLEGMADLGGLKPTRAQVEHLGIQHKYAKV